MASTGTIIYGADYNAVQTIVNEVLGDGTPYGPNNQVLEATQFSLLPPQYNWAEDQTILQTTITYNPYGTVTFPGVNTTTTYYDSTSRNTYYRGAFETTQTGATTVNQYAVGRITYYPDFGYNQITSSTSVATSATITKLQWQNLADDINKVYYHQNGSTFTGYTQVSGKISYNNLNSLNTVINSALATRTQIASSQKSQTFIQSATNNSTWGSGANANSGTQSTVNVSFSSTYATTYFFNQGGSIVFQGIFPGASASAQDQDWVTFMNSFTYAVTSPQYDIMFTATTSSILLAQIKDPLTLSAYSANIIEIWGSNALNTTTIAINVRYLDYHKPIGSPPASQDQVSGGIGFNVYQSTAVGAFNGIVPASITTTSWTTVST
jgi:hypothetical protein